MAMRLMQRSHRKHVMKHRFLRSLFAITALITAPSAMAQEGQDEPEPTTSSRATQEQPGDSSTVVGSVLQQPAGGPRVSLRGSYRLQFESDFDDEPGDFSVNRLIAGIDIAGVINEEFSYSLDFQVEHSSYEFSAASSLAPGTNDPLDDALTLILTPSVRYAINESWAIRAGGAVLLSGEPEADAGDSIRGSVFGGVEHRLSDQLTISLLIVTWSRLEDSASVFPIIGVSWQINELMRLQTRGIGAEFVSDLGNGWSLGARGAWEYREYRLDDRSSAPIPEGIFRDSGVIASLELAWKPSRDAVLAIEAGSVFAQEFEFADRGGSTISETDAEAAFFLGFRASIAF